MTDDDIQQVYSRYKAEKSLLGTSKEVDFLDINGLDHKMCHHDPFLNSELLPRLKLTGTR